jgi:Fic family protein
MTQRNGWSQTKENFSTSRGIAVAIILTAVTAAASVPSSFTSTKVLCSTSLIAAVAVNLDFLCIHPFRDGNGRVSRLLLLLQCYHLGYEVGRYISLERLIERNRERYYETLEASSQRWHQGRHDPWPYVNYVLYVLKTAYREFETRASRTGQRRGEKSEAVVRAIQEQPGAFRVADIQKLAPAAGPDLVRYVLKQLRAQGRVKCLGRGQQAQWRRVGEWN